MPSYLGKTFPGPADLRLKRGPVVIGAIEYQRRVTALLSQAIGPAGFALAGSGAIRDDALLVLAHGHDPVFDSVEFARQLAHVAQLDVRDTVAYGVDAAALERIKQRLLAWAGELGNPP